MKTYFLRFGSGDPRTYAGMAPTFLMFKKSDNTNVTPPSISEVGTSSGIFTFDWGTTQPICFLADAATTSPGSDLRYVTGSLDPSDRADEYGTTLTAIGTSGVALGTTSVALGTTSVALGNTIVALVTGIGNTLSVLNTNIGGIGSTASSFGDSSTDPVDLFGYLKRILETREGNESFIKSTGVLSIYSRGSSTLLATKTIANSISAVIKT